MRPEEIHTAYFIGIGGIGMSALARWFRHNGKNVAGYDKTATSLTDELIAEGISVHFEDNISSLPQALLETKKGALVIYTPAVPRDHQELIYLQNKGYSIAKRSEVLGMITRDCYTIAVAGTHGKTTTSTLIAHILHEAGLNVSAFLGGISKNFETNVLFNDPSKGNPVAVVEADEFDRSFLTLSPDIAIITSSDADHLDIYGKHEALRHSFEAFIECIKPGGQLIIREGQNLKIPAEISHSTYGLQNADSKAGDIKITRGSFFFNYLSNISNIYDIRLNVPGFHNTENTIAAIAVALQMGIDDAVIKRSVESFSGVKRRFDFIFRSEEVTYIDDYAHHPTELEALLKSVRALYPARKIRLIFQPHLFSRTRDFLEEFARVLSTADELILMEIYPARERPIEGIHSAALLSLADLSRKQLLNATQILDQLSNGSPGILITAGAGDIDRLVKPIQKILKSKYYEIAQ